MRSVHVHVPYPRVREHLPLLIEHRLNLEIYFPASALDSLRPGDIEQLMEGLDYGPSISVHAPFMDLSPGAVDPKVRAATMERFSQVIDISEVLAPSVVVFHSGYEKWRYGLRTDIWLEESARTWRPLIERAARLDISLAIENIFEDEPSNLRALMAELHTPNFGICFDTGHCNLFTAVPLAAWLDALGPYIFELHLHDNDRDLDAHLPIGDGTFDFRTLFGRLGDRDIVCTIENHTPERVLSSLNRLKEFFP